MPLSRIDSRNTSVIPFSLKELGIVDAEPESEFDNLTALAQQIMKTPVALVSIVEVENDRQYFKSQQGLPEPWSTLRQTPLSHSFCQHVRQRGEPLIVEDAHVNDLVCNNLAVSELNVRSYLGVPIHDVSGVVIGAFCVIDIEARPWSENDVKTLTQLASCVSDAIYSKAAVRTSEALCNHQREFGYAISHDLKSPAKTIQAVLKEIGESLKVGDIDDALDLVEIGLATSERMTRQVDDVLNFTGVLDQNLQPENICLRTMMDEIVSDLDCDIQTCGATVSIGDISPVNGSRPQLRMLFQNLIENAIKYRSEGRTPHVRISAETSGEHINVAIEDNGIGIDPEYFDEIFKPFHRLHLRSEFAGTGLGLSLCQRVANRHGGMIAVTSTPGTGSRFVVQKLRGAI